MFDFLGAYGHHIVHQYGLAGLFLYSFASATIFVPTSAEIAFPALIMAGVNRLLILAVATAGSILGALLNYYIGLGGERLVQRHIDKKELEKAHRIMDRYGWIGVFGVLVLPLPGDPLTVLCGATQMNKAEFIAVVAAAKAVKYALILGLLSLVF